MTRPWTLFFTVIFATGCSATSTIYSIDAYPIEGEILSSDAQTLRVGLATGVLEVQRDQITEIDYPGNVHVIAGSSIAGVGVLQLMVGTIVLVQGEPLEIALPQIATGGIFVGIGGAMIWWGYRTYTSAKRATAPTGHQRPLPKKKIRKSPGLVVAPLLAPETTGVVVLGEF